MAWKYSLAIRGSVEDIHALTQDLNKLGYEESLSPFSLKEGCHLATHRPGGLEGYDYYSLYDRWIRSADYRLDLPQDRDLILALAAQREGPELHVGEIVVITEITTERLYYITGVSSIPSRYYISCLGEPLCSSPVTGKRLRKATDEEIIKFYNLRDFPQQNRTQAQAGAPIPSAEKRKILGYRSPFDLTYTYNGEERTASAGAIWVKNPEASGYYAEFLPPTHLTLPREIVETWKPVYEEDRVSEFGVSCTSMGERTRLWVKVSANQALILVGTNEVSITDLRRLYAYLTGTPMIAGFIGVVDSFSVGCKHQLTLSDLDKVIKEWDKLNGSKA